MRILSFALLIVCLGLNTNLFGQGLDLSTVTASPKTFIFSNGKSTVPGYIYSTLETESSCCGNDAVYLEVKFGSDGVVTSAKTLTGKNDCYKKSVVDIVKRVRWDAAGVNGSKTIYFEVKPIIPCTGTPNENTYVALSNGNGAVASTPPPTEESSVGSSGTTDPVVVVEEPVEEVEEFLEDPVEEVVEVVEEPVEEVVEVIEEPVEEVVEVVEEPVEEVMEVVATTEDFLSDGGSSDNNSKPSKNNRPSVNTSGSVTGVTPTPAVKYSGPVKIPPQAKLDYNSKGERKPDPSHADTHDNLPGERFGNPQYQEGENQLAIHIRQQLRKTGYCGLAQAAFELTIDPAGNVVDTRVLAVNNEKVNEIIPGIVSSVKFKATGYRSNYRSIHQFKTVLVCGDSEKKINLDNVPNMIEPVGNP